MPSPNYVGTELFPDGQRRRGWGREQYWSELSQAFNPLSVFSGGQKGIYLAPWYSSTLYGSDGITPIAGFNQSVGKIADLSGNGNHAAQSTISKQLIYKLDANSKPYLYGDGLDDVMSFPCLNLVNNIPSITIIAAVAFRSSPTTTKVVFSASMPPSSYGLRQAITGGTAANNLIFATRQLDADPSIFLGNSVVAAGTPTVLTATSDFINRVALFRTNGIQTSISMVGSGGNTSATDSTMISIAGRNDAFADINLYGLLARVPALSSPEYIAAETFFKSKCGV